MDRSRRQRWRVQGILPGIDKHYLTDILRRHPELQPTSTGEQHGDGNGANILTLAYDVGDHNPRQVATVQFTTTPTTLKALPSEPTASLKLDVELSRSSIMRLTIDKGFLGTTVLVSPNADQSSAREQLNVLAISGLGGHPIGSFTSKEDGHFWLADTLPMDLPPYSRVIVYGYDSKLLHSSSRASIDNIATTFYLSLREVLEMQHPLILIGHSLGGLVVKQALIRLAESSTTSKLLDLVSAILFHGVPHDGMDIESLKMVVGDQPNRPLLESLDRKNSSVLEVQREKFFNLFLDRTTAQVFCFYETRDSPVGEMRADGTFQMTGPPECLVSKTSATNCLRPGISSAPYKFAVDKTHSDLVKFQEHDPEYHNVRRIIGQLTNNRHRSQQATATERRPKLTAAQKEALLKSLEFEQMNDRRVNIKKAQRNTCTWLFETDEYCDWLDDDELDNHNGLLWIKGNPGSGKSTLMKVAVEGAPRPYIIVTFFFNARGYGLEKSAEGMYRSIVHQLFKGFTLEDLQNVLEGAGMNLERLAIQEWTIPLLQSLCQGAVQHPSSQALILYIDALDECDTNEIRNVVSFFEDRCVEAVDAGADLRICFASRHYPNVTVEKARFLILDKQDGHAEDIIKYLDANLRIGRQDMANQVRLRLQAKASGIFMWVVLVTAILNKKYAGGRTRDMLQVLDSVPSDLSQLFRSIINTVDDSEEEDASDRARESAFCMLLVSWAVRPLSPVELCHALQSGANASDIYQHDRDSFTTLDQQHYILDVSKGLVEVLSQSEGAATVQFIHESVRDYLVKGNGLTDIVPNLGPDPKGASHEHLARFCIDYMRSCANMLSELGLSDGSGMPFLHYSVENVLNHANAARVARAYRTKAPVHASLAFIEELLSAHDFKLFYLMGYQDQSLQSKRHEPLFMEEEDVNYDGSPIAAALRVWSDAAVRVLEPPSVWPNRAVLKCLSVLKPALDGSDNIGFNIVSIPVAFQEGMINTPNSHGWTTFQDVAAIGSERVSDDVLIPVLDYIARKGANINLPLDSGGFTILGKVIIDVPRRSERFIQFLLEIGADVDLPDRNGRTPLCHAIQLVSDSQDLESGVGNPLGFARLLINNGAQVDRADSRGWTPLMHAAGGGFHQSVRLLVGNGAYVDAVDRNGRTALFHAIAAISLDCAELLIDLGAQVDYQGPDGRVPLHIAIRDGLYDSASLLLRKGARVDFANARGWTHLRYAVEHRPHDLYMMDLLLRRGARPDLADSRGVTPLMRARGKSSELAELLASFVQHTT